MAAAAGPLASPRSCCGNSPAADCKPLAIFTHTLHPNRPALPHPAPPRPVPPPAPQQQLAFLAPEGSLMRVMPASGLCATMMA